MKRTPSKISRNAPVGCLFKAFSQPEASVLKLRYSGLPHVNRAKTQGIIITRRVSEGFKETLRKTQKHNPSLTLRVMIKSTDCERTAADRLAWKMHHA
jgi:hypothetical protein